MALIPRRNRGPLSNFFGDDLFSGSPARMNRGTDLAIDIYEEGGDTVAEMNVPGIDPDDIDVSVNRDQMTVSGSYEDKQKNEDRDYAYRERRFGQFSRSVRLPQEVDVESTEAEYDDGVLRITMPNRDEAEPAGNKIEVKTS
jgi:HSP20 family protein